MGRQPKLSCMTERGYHHNILEQNFPIHELRHDGANKCGNENLDSKGRAILMILSRANRLGARFVRVKSSKSASNFLRAAIWSQTKTYDGWAESMLVRRIGSGSREILRRVLKPISNSRGCRKVLSDLASLGQSLGESIGVQCFKRVATMSINPANASAAQYLTGILMLHVHAPPQLCPPLSLLTHLLTRPSPCPLLLETFIFRLKVPINELTMLLYGSKKKTRNVHGRSVRNSDGSRSLALLQTVEAKYVRETSIEETDGPHVQECDAPLALYFSPSQPRPALPADELE
ncbi:uncharacterized protein F5147DRAFT_657028 [Suillus discolor]|uniref:Uncharacterized protein n=1 Tax=Suillus discolor TaxID=1912936 RepID=A0A9P7JNX4_9AGAM|nr:uncharacterized protein F5147DRAFT_657028 [Suillus discolor]KAG2095150.1 hypothetical protein F5147DRAFT_657028 [Suillus discolor]